MILFFNFSMLKIQFFLQIKKKSKSSYDATRENDKFLIDEAIKKTKEQRQFLLKNDSWNYYVNVCRFSSF
jgi:hypothetical protein